MTKRRLITVEMFFELSVHEKAVRPSDHVDGNDGKRVSMLGMKRFRVERARYFVVLGDEKTLKQWRKRIGSRTNELRKERERERIHTTKLVTRFTLVPRERAFPCRENQWTDWRPEIQSRSIVSWHVRLVGRSRLADPSTRSWANARAPDCRPRTSGCECAPLELSDYERRSFWRTRRSCDREIFDNKHNSSREEFKREQTDKKQTYLVLLDAIVWDLFYSHDCHHGLIFTARVVVQFENQLLENIVRWLGQTDFFIIYQIKYR